MDQITKWKKIKRNFYVLLFLGALFSGGASAYCWNGQAALLCECGLWCLALGFLITETLVGVLTKVKKANPTAIVLLLLAKFSWWGLLFWGSKHIPRGQELPVGLGLGTFLFVLLLSALSQYGWPSISDQNSPRES